MPSRRPCIIAVIPHHLGARRRLCAGWGVGSASIKDNLKDLDAALAVLLRLGA